VADYTRAQPLDATWHRLNSTVRTNEAAFDVREQVPGDGKVVYLSLGSLGCMDVALMQRLIDAMAETEHRTIVSMGPLKDQMKLGPNMYGDRFLPQPSILRSATCSYTHGGNNTVCEGFHFGAADDRPAAVLDQYDNAQRLSETGFGQRLATYGWEPQELVATVDRLLADEILRARMRSNAEAIRADPGRIRGADMIEGVAQGIVGAAPGVGGRRRAAIMRRMTVTIRPLEAADAEACDAIVASLPYHFGLEEGRRECAAAVRSQRGLVAEREGAWWAS